MAELMSGDALQFIAVQLRDGATGETKNGVMRILTSGERVDCILLQNINWWNWHAAGDGHFVHNVAQYLFIAIFTRALQWLTSKRFRHGFSCATQPQTLHAGAKKNNEAGRAGDLKENFWVPPQFTALRAAFLGLRNNDNERKRIKT